MAVRQPKTRSRRTPSKPPQTRVDAAQAQAKANAAAEVRRAARRAEQIRRAAEECAKP